MEIIESLQVTLLLALVLALILSISLMIMGQIRYPRFSCSRFSSIGQRSDHRSPGNRFPDDCSCHSLPMWQGPHPNDWFDLPGFDLNKLFPGEDNARLVYFESDRDLFGDMELIGNSLRRAGFGVRTIKKSPCDQDIATITFTEGTRQTAQIVTKIIKDEWGIDMELVEAQETKYQRFGMDIRLYSRGYVPSLLF